MNRQQLIGITPDALIDIIAKAVRRELDSYGFGTVKQGDIMTEKEAATYMNIKANTLRQWRVQSRGPVYHKQGRCVRYHKDEVDAWLESNRHLTFEAPDVPRS